MVKQYLPKRGDLVWITFDPTIGHEQKGYRPALVVSNDIFNKSSGMIFVCPVTSTNRGYIQHIAIGSERVSGFVMCENLRSVDYKARKVKFIEKVSNVVITNVSNCLEAILSC